MRTTARRMILSSVAAAGLVLGSAAPALASSHGDDDENGHSHSHSDDADEGHGHSHDDEDDDGHGHSHDDAPEGGVDAGFGGAAGGPELLMPLGLAGGAALAAGGAMFLRRRVGQD